MNAMGINPAAGIGRQGGRGRDRLLLAIVLALMVPAVFWPVSRHDFLNYDDNTYVTDNPRVAAGLTWEGTRWAFTATRAANWHPVTWLSHMLDTELFGLDPGRHHLVNVLFHTLNTVALFLLLTAMTGTLWRSAAVAALFGVHPLHVESVAWVAERKDVLSTLFWFLAAAAYLRYARRPAWGRYLPVAALFTLGLMAKPMLVTLPFVLLLLDFWPLGRWRGPVPARGGLSAVRRGLLLEKVPLLVLAAGSSAVTFLAQQKGASVTSLEAFPLLPRIGNALVSYVTYLFKTAWPLDLAVFYPHPGSGTPLWRLLAAVAVLALLSILAVVMSRRRPYLAAGWLWYLGTLVPVIGLVQVGAQAMADRYTYLPLTGVFIMAVWGVADAAGRWRWGRWALAPATAALLALCMVMARGQSLVWGSSESLFRHTLAVTDGNHVAHKYLGIALRKSGKAEEALFHAREALRISPGDAELHNNVGAVYMELGTLPEAVSHLREALRLRPGYVLARVNLGAALVDLGRLEEAGEAFLGALKDDPLNADAHNSLGVVRDGQGRIDEAMTHYHEALRLRPDHADARGNLGVALDKEGRYGEAMVQYREALRLAPGNANTHFNLGNALFHQGRLDEAAASYREALRLRPDFHEARDNLRWTLLRQGR